MKELGRVPASSAGDSVVTRLDVLAANGTGLRINECQRRVVDLAGDAGIQRFVFENSIQAKATAY
jgi:hypothetical protein